MPSNNGVVRPTKFVPKMRADIDISQANPVSGTYYPVLAETSNVEILSVDAIVTWAVTQPNPMVIRVIVDGVTYLFSQANPVSGTFYYAFLHPGLAENAQLFTTTGSEIAPRSPLLKGRRVSVDIAVTWAITQPTPLVSKLRIAKW